MPTQPLLRPHFCDRARVCKRGGGFAGTRDCRGHYCGHGDGLSGHRSGCCPKVVVSVVVLLVAVGVTRS